MKETTGHLEEPAPDLDRLWLRGQSTLTRRKRNVLFPSGVKLCSQETFDQAVSNHLNYFHLRGTGSTAEPAGSDPHQLSGSDQ